MRRREEPQLHRWQPAERAQKPAEREEPAVAVLEPPPPGDEPASVAPIPLLYPMGGPGAKTEFEYLYEQLTAMDNTVQALGGGGGSGGTVVLTNTTQTFTTNQFFRLDTPGGPTATAPVGIIANDANPGITYPLELVHTYAPGVGPVGLAVGLNLKIETNSEGSTKSVATFEGQGRNNADGSLDGSAGINVVASGVGTRVLTVDKDKVEIRLKITDGVPAGGGDITWTFYQARSGGSGQRSLILDRPAADNNPHGIEWTMGGDRKWGIGQDLDATVPDQTDFILLYSYKVLANGRDIFRFSHRAAGSGGVKAIYGANGIGSPAAEGQTFTVIGDATTGVMCLRSQSATLPTLKMEKTGGGKFACVNYADLFQTGVDFANSGGTTWYLRDLVANAHRLFMDGSGNLALGGSNAPVSKLCILAAPSPSANVGLFSLGDGGFSGAAGHFAGSASGTGIGSNHPTGYAGDLINLQVNGATKFRVGPDGTIYKNGVALGTGGDALIGSSNAWSAAQTFTLDDAVTNAPSYPVRVRHTTTGSATNGIGSGVQFEAENTSAGISTLGSLFMQADNAASANLTTSYQFTLFNNTIQRTQLQINADDVRIPQSPKASANFGLLSLGSGGFAGGSGNFQGAGAGTFVAIDMDPGYTGDYFNCQEDGSVRFKLTGAGAVTHSIWDANNSSTSEAMRLEHRLTTGSAAVNFGVELHFRGLDVTGVSSEFYGSVGVEAKDVSGAGMAAELVFKRRQAASITEVMRFTTAGNCRIPVGLEHTGAAVGFFSKPPAAQQTGGAASAGASYGATEQTMLNACYAAMRAYGLLT